MSELRLGTPVQTAGLTLIAIERIRLQTKGQWGIYASKHPFAVIIVRDKHKQVIDCHGEELSLEDLLAQHPQLAETFGLDPGKPGS